MSSQNNLSVCFFVHSARPQFWADLDQRFRKVSNSYKKSPSRSIDGHWYWYHL